LHIGELFHFPLAYHSLRRATILNLDLVGFGRIHLDLG
jgi:hypothetical protein